MMDYQHVGVASTFSPTFAGVLAEAKRLGWVLFESKQFSVIDDSGEELDWALSNQSSSFKGKVAVYSTPRSRSKDWSWLEETINSVPSK
jgi:hypothetical protein